MKIQRHLLVLSALALGLGLPTWTWAQPIVQENFDGVTGVGGGEFFVGGGEGVIAEWDTGLTGENAFAGATVELLKISRCEIFKRLQLPLPAAS